MFGCSFLSLYFATLVGIFLVTRIGIADFLIISIFIVQEVIRIKNEHPDDKQCIVNDRVKGRLKVTRAFGAGFLKQVLRFISICKL